MATKEWSTPVDLGKLDGSAISKKVTFNTADTYVDRNIVVDITATAPDAATLGASATGSAEITTATVGTKASGVYPITGSADITGTASASTTKTGWATKDSTTGTGSTTGTASLNASIPAAAATVTFTGNAANPTIALDTATATKSTAKIGTITTTKPGSGAYVSVKATAPKTTLSATTKTVNTAGYLGDAAEITASAETTAKTGSVYYVPVTAGSLANSATDSVTYAENTSVSIPSEGALYINEGYYPATMITLDQILDGKADTAGVGTDDVISGAVVYDVDGKKLTGTMKNATVVGGDISHTLGAPAYNSTSGAFDMSCDITAGAPTVSQSGFISSSVGTKTASTAVSETHSLDKITGSVAISGTKTVKPAISKATWTPASGVTNAVDTAAATTTAPSGSGVYVAVNSAAKTTNVTAAATVTGEGYGTAANHGISGSGNVAVGASASDTTYVKIKEGSATLSAGDISVTGGTPTLNSSTQKYDITVSGSGSASADVTAGWIKSISDATVNASGTVSLNKAALTHSNTATETKAKVAVTATPTGVSTTTSATSYYITLAQGTVTAGSVKHDASVSEGYVPTAGLKTEATIATSAELSGAGKIYLQTTGLTGALTSAVTQDASHTDHTVSLLASAPASGPYVTLTGSASGTTGKVLSSASGSTSKYMPIYDGGYTIA